MQAYLFIASSLLDSFSAICFILVAVYSLQEMDKRRNRWGGAIYVWLVATCALHFMARVSSMLLQNALGRQVLVLEIADAITGFLIPALLLHLFVAAERSYLPRPAFWSACVGIMYGGSIVGAVAGAGLESGILSAWEPIRTAYTAMLGTAGILAGIAIWASRRALSPLERRQHRWLLFLCGALAAVYVLRSFTHVLWISLFEHLIPLGFIFVITYYVERFTFFDVVIKKGAFAFLSLSLITMFFVLAAPRLLPYRITSVGWALAVWPIVLVHPWLCGKMSLWLDRLWLGRRFSPAEAAAYFMAGLQGAITEEELARRAEAHLNEIFGSQAEVIFAVEVTSDGAPDSMRAPVRSGGQTVGEIRIHARDGNPRFLSEDATLLASLADALAFLRENLRLRDERLKRQERERELVLNAQRSELKALRAQINPHFLFNALNTIAGLIPRHPDRAEQTIEQLAEVFRYTLRRSEREWVRVAEEMDAVRAYLEIEHARFGDRLRFRLESSEEAGDVRIPAMIVQTLVENAVKHGISEVAGAGMVEVRVDMAESFVRIAVRDSGPGFAAGTSVEGSDAGYGLRNIRERLNGYFGPAARLKIGRDAARGMTLVTVDLPSAHKPFEAAAS